MGFNIGKKEIQDIISCKPLIIEKILKKVYNSIQKYSENPNNKINTSDEMVNEISGVGNLNNDRSNNTDNITINYKNDHITHGQENNLKKIIEEKDLKIRELTNIIEVNYNNYNIDIGNEIEKF